MELKERKDMLFEYLIDFICKIVLVGLAAGTIGFFVSCVVLIIGEKAGWW